MEELRARYQGLKEKVAPFITKFIRIIAHLKKSPSTKEQLSLTFSHLRPEYQDYLRDKRLDSFESIEKYERNFERREAIKERYRYPPRRDRDKIPGTTYTRPRRASPKVAAIVESSSTEDSGSPTPKKGKKPKAERQKGARQEVAAMNNRTGPWAPRKKASRNASNSQGDDQGCGSWIWLKLQEVLLYDK